MARPEGLVFCPGAAGREVAERIAGELNLAVFCADMRTGMRSAFGAGVPVIGVCAAGIPIRILAPLIRDKASEPPVICVSPDGRSVVPLLGGHRGANALACRIAALLGGQAAITTASETVLGIALDDPPDGWRLDRLTSVKHTASALLAGKAVRISGKADWLAPLRDLPHVSMQEADGDDNPVILQTADTEPLIYRRQNLALGVGCVRGCGGGELIALVEASLAEAGLSSQSVAQVMSIDIKSNEAAVHALASHLGVAARFLPAEVLGQQAERLSTRSEAVFREVGVYGVSEAAALAAAGPEGELVLRKRKSPVATCAAARIGRAAGETGVPRGHLMIVGIGPGGLDWRTPEAVGMICEADEFVGFGTYLEMLGEFAACKPVHAFALGEEEERCRFALERAGGGRKVALICSGDAGIYAMASPVMQLLADAGSGIPAAARRVRVSCAPGVSAMQAASARAGAVLGHDFCAVSLSDLLTPREAILRRVRAAAEGDFVVAFYNPASKRRKSLLNEARDILLGHRPAETPVLIARNMGRDGEELSLLPLAELKADNIDMLTVVIIGSSASRAFDSGDRSAGADGWYLFTPRGYAPAS
ncbi:MAG: precorrin-3B C(17)-methyltransferase [Rhodobacteraceae bacterium]|nr:precorrin-3B C(17)-methyltransferase [Paracoccaceae bacterium]